MLYLLLFHDCSMLVAGRVDSLGAWGVGVGKNPSEAQPLTKGSRGSQVGNQGIPILFKRLS